MPSAALSGVRVLDLSRVLAAPLAAQMLGDLGAEVIKVERPGAGDEARDYGPPFLKDRDGEPTRDAAFYLSANRNKKSITVDLAKPEGQEIIRALARKSDVVLENFKTGTLAKYGLDYQSLKQVNPRLIYCSVTGFGQTGPLAQKPGYDGVFQAMSGLMSATGHPDGAPGGGPLKIGISMVDILTSHYATSAILSALYHRDVHGGGGQYIDMALLDCGLASLSHYAMNYLVSGVLPPRRGNGGFGGVPSQSFRCADRDIFLVAGNDAQFARFCGAIERPDLCADARFSSTRARIENRDELLLILDKEMVRRTAAEWLDRLDAADVPASPVNNLQDALAHPQVQHRDMLQTVDHPVAGDLHLLRNPIKLSETPIGEATAPPVVGQHTTEILQSLGFDEAKILALRHSRAV
ncbi:CaiB/BaiF CoA transferase family protein [Terricaulis silvestris]|uniref:Formyl-coenzyme A transferase n=1 Tax=Terricaulis silvestris TaxID=2686094 RepID=A0A6I6MLS8_9CAUL|nr:CaiB/BaiF CoA-transferase family protein [Terricaulis silvestris]QGZ96180.1 Formyl-coenzyme A transferase [Terricaulis silvestris]